MGSRFAIGHHDDLFRAMLSGKHLSSQSEAVMHIRPVDVVPRHFRKLRSGNFSRRLGEPDQADEIMWKTRGDERVKRHRHLLCRQEVPSHRHRHR